MAIFHNVEQGTAAWLKARLGIPTASCFDKILTPTGKLSASAEGYMHLLLAERLTGETQTPCKPNDAMERGTLLEPQAASAYAMIKDAEPETIGFITDDAGQYGASPDRLIGHEGLLEIKCPAPKKHVANLLSGAHDPEYTCQIQGQLLVSGRAWVDFMSYHPTIPPLIVRVYRDENYIAKLQEALHVFCETLNSTHQKLLQLTN